ncbi:MAG: glutamate 5-kinase [Candidatus Muproteobacteria bacterium RIFCSPHIGHO2_12_FULL_60_33]|nr:MAG: glutamate 5-kinase [Candidatus Muproteobacteria bacterium RIFCSPHIGHO2_01_60_12]OGI54380.1 MAG: glutamate 5-kinase [Candidatus Muproteobacteria bacterium RIFCSPHIGHO2_12_FULL_60_33]OGI59150.1 MAG: glutamate 5-kinase [Candidatus Muproteobacteria bacterium RIFCSPHIGHO2_01_FULL_61_200]
MSHNPRNSLKNKRRIVVKIGSALLTRDGQGLNSEGIHDWAAQLSQVCGRGMEVVLVSSGAVAAGMQRLGRRVRPHALHELQAMAAVGQMNLVQVYESAFQRHGLHTAQVLLTHDDLTNRTRYLNSRTTLRTLLGFGVIPIVNENDTVATEEIRFGDNDTLAALVANLIEADLLLILTDQHGLYERDPRQDPGAKLLVEGNAGDPQLLTMAGGSGALGRGGMRSKLLAAEKAARSGASTVIASGREKNVITRVLDGETIGTHLHAAQGRVAARKQWLAGQARAAGKLKLDAGAVKVIRDSGKSLLPVGVKAVEGIFTRGEIVSCLDPEGHEVARGLVNYSSEEAGRIIGKASDKIESILGYVDEPELIHRDNMVVL